MTESARVMEAVVEFVGRAGWSDSPAEGAATARRGVVDGLGAKP